jgi:hypothetical protein
VTLMVGRAALWPKVPCATSPPALSVRNGARTSNFAEWFVGHL